MTTTNGWDWENKEKSIPFKEWEDNFEWVEEPYVSDDGEKIGAIVNLDENLGK